MNMTEFMTIISPTFQNNKSPQWSPYGCHYYPDPEEFPDPNPSTLPEQPLDKGEQYFLDLAGNIKKGPISKVGLF